MTRLAVCRECKHIFFTKHRIKHRNLRCRRCGSRDIMAWSARLLNRYGIEALRDLLPETSYQSPGKKKRGRLPGTKLKTTPKGSPLPLTSGHIERFHQKYRNYKENQRMQREYNPRIPDQDPPVHIVAEWYRDSGKSIVVRSRWALELLEKHKPKEYSE